ncbi:proton-coupled folate transporter-like isoform X1 [Limulus polyphemus]|uniref:Proton-coupled folate transporter-like isoform X1 n=1 Tax=Limulus polyphemus TaxID=6850 RepID=A0ABM1TJL0_LIMPO|nr:proton-coupled folate transporter-like isoform X1 [Limulus polyphemus]XP_022256067.1 proton-coupled folate transporter-like isoform X1 [Limulus polyphemus]
MESLRRAFYRLVSNLKYVTVEPLVTLIFFAFMVRGVCYQQLMLDKACYNEIRYSSDVCSNLNDEKYKLQKDEVQRMANNYHMGTTIVSTLPAIILSIFIGPWSDKYGRRYPLIVALLGFLLEGIGVIIVTARFELPLYFNLLIHIPSGLSGGMIMIFTSVYSYISDVSDTESRPFRYALLEMGVVLGAPLGTQVGGQIYKHHGYIPVFSTSLVFIILSVAYVIFIVKESKKISKDVKLKTVALDFFSVDNVKESLSTCLKKRPGNARLQIWLLIIAICFQLFVNMGTFTIAYLYTLKMYKWDVARYSNIYAIFSVISAFTTIVAVPFLTRFVKIRDVALGLIGILSMQAKCVFLASSFEEWVYLLGLSASILHGTSSIAIRTRLSKMVAKDELGKVFSLMAMCESAIPVLGTVIWSQVYNNSLEFYPGLTYLVCAIVLIIPLTIFIWLLCSQDVYHTLEEENDVKITQLNEVANAVIGEEKKV